MPLTDTQPGAPELTLNAMFCAMADEIQAMECALNGAGDAE